jgi:putative pyruvate formate lyase activating enzyme
LVEAVKLAARDGLELPIVWNCGGYESLEAIKLLAGIVDIYMPDIKYSSAESGRRYSAAPDYFDVARAVVKEMNRQVGDLQFDSRGIAQRGLLIRHLVMPGGVAGSDEVLRFIAEEISKNAYVNIMDQYRPLYKASYRAEINRPITRGEFEEAVGLAMKHGLEIGS